MKAAVIAEKAEHSPGMQLSVKVCRGNFSVLVIPLFAFAHCAGPKDNQFASHSQPTLNAVWKHAPSRLRQLPGRPCPPAQPPPAQQHAPPEALNCTVTDPDPALLQPAEVSKK